MVPAFGPLRQMATVTLFPSPALLPGMSHRFRCPFCSQRFDQDQNPEGPNFCPTCRRLFLVQLPPQMPVWVLGIVVIVMVCWLSMR